MKLPSSDAVYHGVEAGVGAAEGVKHKERLLILGSHCRLPEASPWKQNAGQGRALIGCFPGPHSSHAFEDGFGKTEQILQLASGLGS